MPQVMGILNVTPDSFSDGGRHLDLDSAVARGREMIAEGAAVIDVGGESTRPGAEPVSIDDELARVVPVVRALASLGTPVSVDTRHAEVAHAAIDAGATIVNDVSASLWPVAAERGAGWIAMHMAGDPRTMQTSPQYRDVVVEVHDFLVERATAAVDAGVTRVWIDPGFGFGKTAEHNIELVAAIDRLVATGFGVVLGASRKSTLGVLAARSDARVGIDAGALTPVDDRLAPGIAMATWAMCAGVTMVRVHDVRAHVQAAAVVAGTIPPAANVAAPAEDG